MLKIHEYERYTRLTRLSNFGYGHGYLGVMSAGLCGSWAAGKDSRFG